MSKVMATSGNHAPVIKGTAAGGDAAADGATSGLFAAFLVACNRRDNTDADAAQAQKDTQESEKIIDPHLAALLGAMRRPYPEMTKQIHRQVMSAKRWVRPGKG